jgi:hypothetical protein
MLVSSKHFYHTFEHFSSMSYQHKGHFPFHSCADLAFSTNQKTPLGEKN